MKSALSLFFTTLAVALLACGAFALDFYKHNDRALPRTVLADISLGGKTRAEVRALIHNKIESYLGTPLKVAARGDVKEITPRELGVIFDESAMVDAVPFAGTIPTAQAIVMSVAGERVSSVITVSAPDVLRRIDEKFPDIPDARNAHVIHQGGVIKIVPEQVGLRPLVEPIVDQLKRDGAFFELTPILVALDDSPPTLRAQDLEPYRAEIQKILPRTVVLNYEKESWSIDFFKHADWVSFEQPTVQTEDGQKDGNFTATGSSSLPFIMTIEPVAFSRYVSETLAPKLEQPAEDVNITMNEKGRAEFVGRGNAGRVIDRDALFIGMNGLLGSGNDTANNKMDIPMSVVEPKLTIAPELSLLGINELVGVGYTRFEGSPANRMHNIGVGIAKYNGIIIPQGETFSFNKNLGEVDAKNGYKMELVIKPEGTIPEFGGGLCQVSSTLYRAALYSGLPIVKRSPHSYAVGYYAQIGGHGLDATIYPPSVDLKFTNDTPGALLIQSYVDGPSAYFKFYGTKDDRQVTMEGPYISNKHSLPPTPVLVYDPKLPVGSRRVAEKPHTGMDALWYRILVKGGVTVKEEIKSRYKAMPQKVVVGGPAPAAIVPTTDVVNPFE